MIAFACEHETTVKCGKHASGRQRLRCKVCGKYLVADEPRPIGDMRIDFDQAVMALGMLLEGMSIRATERLTGLHRDTIDELILTVGENCQRLLDSTIKGMAVDDVQLDEIWSFVAMKEKTRIRKGHSEEFGDSYTFIGIDRKTKLVLAHLVGKRDNETCVAFLRKLNKATTGRFQLSTDGFNGYTLNAPFELGSRIDFAQLVKTYESTQEVTRYSPAKIISAEKTPVFGNPDWDRICTSHVERMNLTVRMQVRRFTRLTNAHSKSPKHHVAMQAIFFCWYNFSRKHETLKGRTPAMAAGITDRAWSIRELLEQITEC